jgi:colanic acid biosynthesis glycosyl transferase WcaI
VARLLFAAINYWPEPTGTAPYTTRFAEHLASLGHDVRVLAGMPHYPTWRVFDQYAGRVRVEEHRNGVAISRRRHYVPSHQSALERARYEGSFTIRALAAKIPDADAVIGIVPSLNGAILARMLTRGTRPYGVLFQDMMGPAAQQSGIQGGSGSAARVARRLEWWAVARAAAVATVSESFLPHLHALGFDADRLVLTPNWPHLAMPNVEERERSDLRQSLGWHSETQVVLHAGNMGLKQGLEQVVSSARLADALELPVLFVLLGDGNQRVHLERKARGVKRLRFLASQPDDRYMRILAAADVLLVSERESSLSMSLPSKLTSYFLTGRPVLAAVPPDGGTAREIMRSGAGIVVPPSQPRRLLRALEDIRLTADLGRRLGAAGQLYAERHLSEPAALSRLEAFADRILAAA